MDGFLKRNYNDVYTSKPKPRIDQFEQETGWA